MSTDDNKTLRSFYCQDKIWEAFEEAAKEANCSMDELVNRAMRSHIEEQGDEPLELSEEDQVLPLGQDSIVDDSLRKTQRQDSSSKGMHHKTFKRLPQVDKSEEPDREPPEMELKKEEVSPKPPASEIPDEKPLYLIFKGNKYLINKEHFVIGRGSERTDLTIRDGNISRTHCAIVKKDGARYLKDLDSTNGVDYQGRQIHSKKIKDGDVFYLCDYAFQFRYGD